MPREAETAVAMPEEAGDDDQYLHVRIDGSLGQQVKERAKADDDTVSQLVRRALRHYLRTTAVRL
jgi:predicted HicB family RNase H-like nuclease